MPDLLIRDVPSGLEARLREAAMRHQREIDREALAILEEALGGEPYRVPRFHPVRGRTPITQAFLDEAIREGRE